MKEKFKMSCKHKGTVFYDTVEGEEVFRVHGYRFFIMRNHEEGNWIISDARYGARVYTSMHYGDAIKRARKKIANNFPKYLSKLKETVRPRWRYDKRNASERPLNESAAV